jgi:hypothetical protein
MTNNEPISLPVPTFAGGTRAITMTPVVGTPRRDYAEMFNAAHTAPSAAGKVFGLVKPRVAGRWHTLLSPRVISMIFSELGAVYDGPVVQTRTLRCST